MPSSTVEDYLKQIYLEEQRAGGLVSTGRLAEAVGVSPGTATTMIKALDESGLVRYEPRTGVRLSPRGRRLALRVLRRHRLIELFLVRTLGLDWSEVHEEAEELEHAVSDKVLERIDQALGHPSVDPHGDPIPAADGSVARSDLSSLAECRMNTPQRIARVMDQNPQFLQLMDQQGLTPGTRVVVRERNELSDSISVAPHRRSAISLGGTAAAKILVEPIDPNGDGA